MGYQIIYMQKIKIQPVHDNKHPLEIIILPIAFSTSLLLFRMAYTGSMHFAFLLWNLFLALLPLLISNFMTGNINKGYLLLLLGGLWLLFLPNAPYIITDFFHLKDKSPIPIWYDLFLILGFAWCGLLFWLISMIQVTSLIRKKVKPKYHILILQGLILMSALGVYLGRYGRWNSWDIFFYPFEIISSVGYMIVNPGSFPGFYGMTLALYFFLALFFSFFLQLTNTPLLYRLQPNTN